MHRGSSRGIIEKIKPLAALRWSASGSLHRVFSNPIHYCEVRKLDEFVGSEAAGEQKEGWGLPGAFAVPLGWGWPATVIWDGMK